MSHLEIAKHLYNIHHTASITHKEKDAVWDAIWDELKQHFGCNYTRICYVLDLLLEKRLLETYGVCSCLQSDRKCHLLRGMDKFHW